MRDDLKWPAAVPKSFYWQAMENIEKQRLRELKAAQTYHEGMDRLKEEYRKKLYEIIGNNNLKLYKKLHATRLDRLRQANIGIVDPVALDVLRQQLVKASSETIEKSGVNLTALKALRESSGKKAESLFKRSIGKGKNGIQVAKPHNTDFYPPYLLDAREYEHYESEASLPNPQLTRYFNNWTGDFGSRTRIHVSGADEWDLVSATCRTGFLVIYHNTRVGQPILNIDLEAVSLNYHGRITNECGRSDASVRQLARLFGQVYLDGTEAHRTYFPLELFNNFRSAKSDNWSATVMSPGHDQNVSFVLATPLPADTYVLIGVGLEMYNSYLSNDCGIDSTVEARFLARRIGVTTTT
ncbi:MAG: hypothetical protein V2B20_05575 [Pseudomonadota bacterium]